MLDCKICRTYYQELVYQELVARNISLEELARRVGMSLNEISEISDGKKVITASMANLTICKQKSGRTILKICLLIFIFLNRIHPEPSD